ncbi:RDD family protein [Cohnella hashimotonis]|uniref:RDD family protein n=1 Tax=Cohnella hashimotonis TaxID=2826895 RepID=A0ABT6TTG6_9BACL|nr:RDD family protein [Cohnella hashimotonis]MDI4649224.1 RDD family protein [Cohnella hashimotonis]
MKELLLHHSFENKLYFDWSESCIEGKSLHFLDGSLDRYSGISIYDENNEFVADGWMDFEFDPSSNQLSVYWSFLDIYLNGQKIKSIQMDKMPTSSENRLMERTQENDFIYFGFWKRVLMRIIDFGIIFIPLGLLYRFAVYESVQMNSILPYILMWIVTSAYYVLTLSIFGGTPGKLILKAKVVDHSGNQLSFYQSLLRSIFYILYAVTMIFAFSDANFKPINAPFDVIAQLIGVVTILSDLIVLFNRRKKALHDYIAGSVVIKQPFSQKKDRASSKKRPLSDGRDYTFGEIKR